MTLTGAAGLFVGVAAKAGLSFAADLGAEALGKALEQFFGACNTPEAQKALVGIATATLEHSPLKRSTKQQLMREPTVLDLAGIAWSDALLSRNNDEFAVAFGAAGKDFVRRFDALWLGQKLLSPEGRRLALMIPEIEKDSSAYIDSLCNFVADSIAEELGEDRDIESDLFLLSILREVPSRIEQFFASIPSVQVSAIARISEEILKEVSGVNAQTAAQLGMRQLAQKYVAAREKDVFGRDAESDSDLPLLPLAKTYVEPRAVTKGGGCVDAQLVKQTIRALLNDPSVELITLEAPFGYGKSLTSRAFAADLAEEWLSAKVGARFPLLLRCPSVLSGHVATLDGAVLRELQTEADVTAAVAERIWADNQLVLILDSFDEVELPEPQAKSWFTEIKRISKDRRVRIILTGRDYAFEDHWFAKTDRQVIIQEFDALEGQRWLDAACPILKQPTLAFSSIVEKLDSVTAGTPILLLMASYAWDISNEAASVTKGDLYANFIDKISLGKWAGVQEVHPLVGAAARSLEEKGGERAFQRALGLLAWAHLKEEQHADDGLTRQKLAKYLEAEFRGLTAQHIAEVTKSLCLSMFIRKESNSEVLEFSHRSFREYLTAEHTLRRLMTYVAEATPDTEIPVALTLGEAGLNFQELRFCVDIASKLDAHQRERLLNVLDRLHHDMRLVFRKSAAELRVASTSQNVELGRVPASADLSSILRSNCERLSNRLRGINSTYVAARVPSMSTADYEYRVLGSSWNVDFEANYGPAYTAKSGVYCSVLPVEYLPEYIDVHASFPDLFLPVTLKRKTYFVCAGDNVSFEPSPSLALVIEMGRQMRTLEAAGFFCHDQQSSMFTQNYRPVFAGLPTKEYPSYMVKQSWRRSVQNVLDHHVAIDSFPWAKEDPEGWKVYMRLLPQLLASPDWDEAIGAAEEFLPVCDRWASTINELRSSQT